MKTIRRFFRKLITVPAAVLAGNWVGGHLRYILTGDRLQTIQFKFETHKGRQMTNSPVATKFYPGLLISLFGKPRWLYGFLGGILTGALVPDHLEHYWLEFVIEPVFVDRVLGEKGQTEQTRS
jgi:hypothetical protein